MSPIILAVELTDDAHAWELAQFIKRLRFHQCYELTEAWRSRAERQEQAYRMLNALDRVRDALEVAGFAPR